MKKIIYTKTKQVVQYEPFAVTAEIERGPGESLEQFIVRSVKEFAMLYNNAEVFRK